MKKLAGPTESPADPRRDNSHRMRTYKIVFNRIPSDTNRWKQKLKLKRKRKQKRRYIQHIAALAWLCKNFVPTGSCIPVARLNTLPATRSGNHSHVPIPPVCAGVPLPPVVPPWALAGGAVGTGGGCGAACSIFPAGAGSCSRLLRRGK